MSTIPASLFVNVVPSVLGVGGQSIDILGLVVTNSNRVPLGSVYSFSSASAVATFFGSSSQEAIMAAGASGKGSGYFAGFTNCDALPSALLFTQYNAAAAPAYIWGGNVGAALTLAELQAIVTGSLIVDMDGVTRTASGINLSAASSFSAAAGLLQTDLNAVLATIASFTASIASNVLTVTVLNTGTISPGQAVLGSGVDSGLYITSQLTGSAGGIGTYQLSGTDTVGSEAMTTQGFPLVVTYDSTSGAFKVTSGITGEISTSDFASGTLADTLLLSESTGAVLQQGAAAATPAGIMNGVVEMTTDWASYTTSFDPDGGSGHALKAEFAAWKNAYPNRYMYVCWDTAVVARGNPPQAASLGAELLANSDSGTFLLSELTDLNQAAFVLAIGASIDFLKTNGRVDYAFRNQAGLVSDVTSGQVAVNLGGNPQSIGDFGNGYNYYGAVGSANEGFVWLQRGTVTGQFKWADSYINQIWFNNLCQSALLNFLDVNKSTPFNTAGAAMIEAVLADPIQAGLNFGVFAPGDISASQIAQVNAQAGSSIAASLQAQGYYLQVKQQSAQVRVNRGPWAITLWYLDRGSVQSIRLNSVAVQ